MNAWKKSPVLLVFCAALGFAFAVETKEFNQTVPFSAGETLRIKTFKGSIHLSAWDKSEVSVYARIAPPEGESADYAARVVEATKVEVRRSGSTLTIRSDYDDVPSKGSWGNWFGESKNLAFVHYDIKAPRNLKLDLEDYKSDIEIYGLAGDMDVETYKGGLKASDLEGRLRLDTYKGKAELTDLSGSLDVETYKGEVSIQSSRIDANSKLETYKGEITLSIPANQGLEIRGDLGRKATLVNEFAVEAESAGERRDRRKDKTVSLSVNGGGPRLSLSSYKGEIRIRRW